MSKQSAKWKLPDSRVVLFGDVVYKLKYRISDLYSSSSLGDHMVPQTELANITKGILQTLQRHDKLIPLQGNHIAVYPATTLWSTGNTIQIFEGCQELKVYPKAISLLIEPLSCHRLESRSSKRSLDLTSEQISKKAKTVEGSNDDVPSTSVPSPSKDMSSSTNDNNAINNSWWSKFVRI